MTEHLNEHEVSAYRARSLSAQEMLRTSNHLAKCEECRARIASPTDTYLSVQKIRLTLVAGIASSEHLTYQDEAAYADGDLRESDLRRMRIHLERCKQCSGDMRKIQSLKRELLRSAWNVRLPIGRFGVSAWLGIPTLAACAVAVVMIVLHFENSPSRVEKLLAEAYTEQRTVELRIPYAAHSDFHQRMGGGSSLLTLPESLRNATDQVASALKQNPDDPSWLLVSARVDLLDWRYSSALTTLDRIQADNSEVRLTRALAWYEKAEEEQDQQAYGDAVDALGKTLQSTPDDPIALFNQAVICEKLHMYECASRDYERVLKVEKDAGWVAEARDRLSRIMERKNSRIMNLQRLQDTKAMRADLNAGHQLSSIQTEAYAEVALQDLLDGQYKTSGQTRQPFMELASALVLTHQDRWFADFLAAKTPAGAGELLRTSIVANRRGDPHSARKAAENARDRFLVAGNQPGAARSEFELIYALQREFLAKECIQEIPTFARLLMGKQYRWLDAQLQLELSSCKSMLVDFDSTWRAANEADRIAKNSNYESLVLRAKGFEAELSTDEGRLHHAWTSDMSGLDAFWRGICSSDRGYQFYQDLETVAELSNQWHLGVLLGREMLAMLRETDHKEVVAIAHFELGTILGHLGLDQESEEEINQSYTLLSQLPRTPATDLYKSGCEILLAALDIHRGSREAALSRLRRVDLEIRGINNFDLQLDYLNVSSQAARLGGDYMEEERILSSIVSVAKKGLKTLHSEKDRWDWDRRVGSAYRRLFELRIAREHNVTELLTDWEAYRQQSILGVLPHAGGRARNVETQVDDDRLKRWHGSVFVTFAVLPQEVVAWVEEGQAVREVKIAITQEELLRQVREFYRLCSDPSSALERVNDTGSRLYKELLAPLIVGADQTVVIDADGILGMIPWSALLTDKGFYFGQLQTVISIVTPLSKKTRPTSRRGPALIVYPGPVTLEGEKYLALPAAEIAADDAAAVAPETIVLKNKDATSKRLLTELRKSSVFYFAGHAIQREQGGELILQGAYGGDILSADTLQGLSLPHTELVVLSACSTALAEDDVSHDPHGLVWAFLKAGSNEVVASLWDVDSSATAALMKDFYTVFQQQRFATSALATAQRAALDRHPGLHPYYWASFQLFSTAT